MKKTITSQIAKHVRDVHFGGNWTTTNLKEILSDVTWKQATTPIYNCNSILALTYHINYYISAVLKVLQGHPLIAKDALSFNHPQITSDKDWNAFLENIWTDAKVFADLIETLPDETLLDTFIDEKYGDYFRNLHGILEHSHYHLGQIAIIKKIGLQLET